MSVFKLFYCWTQPDKIDSTLNKFENILNYMPKSENAFNLSKNSIIKRINSERIIKNDIIITYLKYKDLGIDTDYRKDIYEKVSQFILEDLNQFFNEIIKGNNYNILVIGSKEMIDFEVLSKYGKVQVLNLKEIFNY